MDATRLPSPVEDAENVDGRTLRRTRNRTAVIVALLELIREGNLEPSTSDIAERAGVSDRSIFRYFDDLDDLVRTTIDHALSEAGVVGAIENFGLGTLDERITRFVDARLKLFDHMDGPLRVARMRAPAIPSIDAEFTAIMEYTRGLIGRQFGPELAAWPESARQHIVDAVLVLSAYDTYAIHTRILHSTPERTRAALCGAIRALLRPPSPADDAAD